MSRAPTSFVEELLPITHRDCTILNFKPKKFLFLCYMLTLKKKLKKKKKKKTQTNRQKKSPWSEKNYGEIVRNGSFIGKQTFVTHQC